MRTCSSCGSPIRDGADFCSACGTRFGAAANNNPTSDGGTMLTTVPLITLAPQETTFSKRRMIRYGKALGGVVLVVVLALIAAAVVAWMSTDPFKTSAFEAVENENYRECLALVSDVRNSNFDDIVSDIVNMEGEAENYNFLEEYEMLFKQIVPDDSDPTAVKFRNCCFMVSYAEFTAKKYKNYADGFFGFMYVDDADKFRAHADTLWEMLNTAETDDELQAIIDYCSDNDIIYLKGVSDAPAEPVEPAETAETPVDQN